MKLTSKNALEIVPLHRLRVRPGFWYVGSPYSKYAHGLDAAHTEICRVTAMLILEGVPVFSPIAHSHPVAKVSGIDPLDHELWLPADRPLMEAAHGLIAVTMPGWHESVGLKHEIEYFDQAGKPIVWLEP